MPSSPGTPAPLTPQLAKPLFTLANAAPGEHVMTLKVSPDDLGPLTVRAHIDASGVRIELFAAGDAGREAVRGILPELHKELAEAGFGANLQLSDRNAPADTGQGSNRDGATRQNVPGSDPQPDSPGEGRRNGSGEARNRWNNPADANPARPAELLDGSQTTLNILV